MEEHRLAMSLRCIYNQMSPKKLTNFRIDVELLRGLEELRDRKDFAVSWQVRQAIKEWLQKYDVEIKKEVKMPRASQKRAG
jgi:Arc/MetJ-type ribon-helix-helix transcriptional regulator